MSELKVRVKAADVVKSPVLYISWTAVFCNAT